MKTFYFLILSFLFLQSCNKEKQDSIFEILDYRDTGLNFSNDLVSTPDFNILSYLYFYNGGGVAIGDINNDGLPDIYLCGNQVDDKLFINKGDFKFVDFSHSLPKNDLDGWSTGVTLVDINNDGFLDIYVSKLGVFKSLKDSNKLFVNNSGKSFTEESKKYNLDFSGYATQAAFLDYDRDGDLDCYLLNHSIKDPSQFKSSSIRLIKDSISGDKFLENIGGKFVDVTKSANIYSSNIGFGLGIDVADVNNDGWLDIYIGNDFHEQDYLYINQGDKTFKESIEISTGHTSNFSMGCSIADINNDLKLDIVTMDMKPPTYEDYKKSGGWESMQIYNYKRSFGYHHQSPKNCVQINMGNQNENPKFSDQSGYYNLSATDWSWAPLIYDFDNDGDKDIFVTNGIQYRPNDLDFIKFHFSNSDENDLEKLDLMPSGLVKNIYFENELNKNKFTRSSVGKYNATTGAAVADLNLDGKLDIVLNEVNGSVKVLRNNVQTKSDYVSISLQASDNNNFGLGASVKLYQDSLVQSCTVKSSFGFQSCGPSSIHFGISNSRLDSLVIIWPDGHLQTEYDLEPNRNSQFVIKQKENLDLFSSEENDVPIKVVPNFKVSMSNPQNQIAEKWLLYDPECTYNLMFPIDSTSCFVLNDNYHSLSILNYEKKKISPVLIRGLEKNVKFLHAGCSLKTGYYLLTQSSNSKIFSTQFHQLNNNFEIITSKSIEINNDISNAKILIEDFDFDNDLDIAIGGAYKKGHYGNASPTRCFINTGDYFEIIDLLDNDLVYDMQFVNLDSDKDLELVVVGHWFPITIIDDIKLKPNYFEIESSSGLWFSVKIDDFNSDGTLELLAGNFGNNHDLKVNQVNPLRLYSNDFDLNGVNEALITCTEKGRELPYFGHETFIDQLPIIKRTFIKASDFANAEITDIIDNGKLEQSIQKDVVTLNSACFEFKNNNWTKKDINSGLDKFPVTNIVYNENLVLAMGNIESIDPNLGKQDAGTIMPFRLSNEESKLFVDLERFPIEQSVVWDAILVDSTLYYITQNDSLKYFHF